MARYLGGRLVSGLLTLFLFVTLLFFLINIALPGDWTSQFILTADAREALRESLGLDEPLYVQYWIWIRGIFTLSLGESLGRGDVWEALMAALPSTLLVLVVGLLIAFLLGGWMGRFAAYDSSSYLSAPMTFVAILFLTAFPPVLAVLLEQGLLNTFGHYGLGRLGSIDFETWDWDAISAGDALGPSQILWRMIFVLVVTVTLLWVAERVYGAVARKRAPRWLFLIAMVGIPLVVWYQMGITGFVFDVATSLALLLVGVVILTFGDVMLVTRAAMDDVMLEDYVQVARAKGMPEKQVRDKHAARTALLPVLSRFTVSIPYFLTGLVILEAAFAGAGVAGIGIVSYVSGPEGLGSLLFEAVVDQDTYLIMGAMLVIGLLTLLLRIGLDVAHAALDPRIRFGNANGN